MYLPKADIYAVLKNINNSYYVSQTQPPVFEVLPAIIFRVDNNIINTDLDNNITHQNVDITVDIWADDSVTASNVLSEVEEALRNNQWQMTNSMDVPNIGNVFHIVSRFSNIF